MDIPVIKRNDEEVNLCYYYYSLQTAFDNFTVLSIYIDNCIDEFYGREQFIYLITINDSCNLIDYIQVAYHHTHEFMPDESINFSNKGSLYYDDDLIIFFDNPQIEKDYKYKSDTTYLDGFSNSVYLDYFVNNKGLFELKK